MNELTSFRRRPVYLPMPLRLQSVDSSRRVPWLGWLFIGLMAGYLLFAHGCHGEEEDDLVLRSIKAAGPQSPGASAGTRSNC